jgi:hypothetical protein
MPQIRPINDLRNTNEISEIVLRKEKADIHNEERLWRFSCYEH